VDDGDINNDRQALLFEPIHDADHRVFFNVGALRQDKADATECWVITPTPRKQYEREYGKYTTGFQPLRTTFTWSSDQIVNVCEYYTVTNKRQKTELYRALDGEETRHFTVDLNDGERDRLEAGGAVHVEGRDRMIKRRQVRKYVLNGREVLKDCGVIPGEFIPVVMCLMDRDVIDGREYCQGVVRDGRDPQVVKNVLSSALLDDAGQGLREQPIIDPAQIPAAYMSHWSRANRGKYAFLPMSAMRDPEGNIVAGPAVQYTKPMSVPPLVAALLQASDTDLDAMLGTKKAEDTDARYHQSGIALELENERGDEHHAIYMQDFSVFKAHQARVWLSMASEIYVEEDRVMRGVDKNDKTDQIYINRPVQDERSGAVRFEADMANARFDIAADLGPSAASRRDATARRLAALAAAPGMAPEDAAVLTAAAVQHIDLDEGAEVKEHFRRRLVNMGAASPTDEDKERAAAAADSTPTPEAQYYESAAAAEKAKAVETLAGVEKTEAQTDKLRAETNAIYVESNNTPLRGQ